jgi:hypothetical protein
MAQFVRALSLLAGRDSVSIGAAPGLDWDGSYALTEK